MVKNVALLLDFVWFSVGLAVFAGSHRVIVHHHVHSVLPPLVAISWRIKSVGIERPLRMSLNSYTFSKMPVQHTAPNEIVKKKSY